MSLWTDFLGAEQRWVTALDARTRVVSAGSGDPAIVLLHGRGGHLETWRANLLALADRGHRTIAFDLLGHGLTEGSGDDWSIARLARHADMTIALLGIENAVLVGQSIGAWVAALVALQRPWVARSLVLIEPAGLQSERERTADPAIAAKLAQGARVFAEPTLAAVRERFDLLVHDPSVVDDELVAVRQRLYAPPEARAVHRAVRSADNDDDLLRPEVLAQLDLEVLLLRGEHSHTPPEVFEQALAALPAGRLEVVPGARQWPQLERPDVVNRLVAGLAAGTG
jgi:2-hydroxy-6-oxonona-2,4-dienedioate hydrolase